MKQKTIGIIGSGKEPWTDYVEPLARWIARQNFNLLTGGGGGVMAAASKAFVRETNRTGVCLGIIPTKPDDKLGFIPHKGYPNPWVEIAIISPLSTLDRDRPKSISRNYTCVLSSDLLVALPGSEGTKNEIDLAISFQKPLILLAPPTEMLDFPANLPRTDSIQTVKEFILEWFKMAEV